MTFKKLHVYAQFVVALFLIVACIPTTATVPSQQPLSTSNPNMFSTMVAETAMALMTQTGNAMPLPTATPAYPTETLTPLPTETAVVSQEGTSLTRQDDASTLFVDNVAGLKVSIPEGWVVVRLNEQEYFDAWAKAVDDPVLSYSMEFVQSLDPAIFRAHAFNTNPEYVHEELGTTIDVIFLENDPKSLEEVAEVEKQPKAYEGFEIISAEYQVRPDGLELFILEEQWQGLSSLGQPVPVYYKRVVFKVSSGTVDIDLLVPREIMNDVLPEFDLMIEQLSVFTP